jgi:hypothetical protein
MLVFAFVSDRGGLGEGILLRPIVGIVLCELPAGGVGLVTVMLGSRLRSTTPGACHCSEPRGFVISMAVVEELALLGSVIEPCRSSELLGRWPAVEDPEGGLPNEDCENSLSFSVIGVTGNPS